MFGINSTTGNSGGSSSSGIVKSGYDVDASIQGFGKLRKDFAESLKMNPEDITEDKILQNAEMEGKARGFLSMYKRGSAQKLKVAQALVQTYGAAWQHSQQAAGLENQWRQTTARNLEQMSEKIMDLKTVDRSHTGFASYSDSADKLISY
jgi:hypothetical protein